MLPTPILNVAVSSFSEKYFTSRVSVEETAYKICLKKGKRITHCEQVILAGNSPLHIKCWIMYYYSLRVIKGRWIEAEKYLVSSAWWHEYEFTHHKQFQVFQGLDTK
jgi:hypothetical protein